MIVNFIPGAGASTVSPAVLSNTVPSDAVRAGDSAQSCPLPTASREQVRHLLFGSLGGVQHSIAHLHALGYADPNDWSRPISTGRPNEVMAILTKRIK